MTAQDFSLRRMITQSEIGQPEDNSKENSNHQKIPKTLVSTLLALWENAH